MLPFELPFRWLAGDKGWDRKARALSRLGIWAVDRTNCGGGNRPGYFARKRVSSCQSASSTGRRRAVGRPGYRVRRDQATLDLPSRMLLDAIRLGLSGGRASTEFSPMRLLQGRQYIQHEECQKRTFWWNTEFWKLPRHAGMPSDLNSLESL